MKNTFGNNITLTLFGESHGDEIGAVLDGVSPGVPVDMDYIRRELNKRKPHGCISTSRTEEDDFRFISGVFNGKTSGTPITVIIKNKEQNSSDYASSSDIPRPSHADLTAHIKYKGFEDPRGGGHFSGRLTAPIVALCAILKRDLEDKGIFIGSHILRIGGIQDKHFSDDKNELLCEIKNMSDSLFPTLDCGTNKKMIDLIKETANEKDSVGGILETAVTGLPIGLGEPFFDSVESLISHAVFSVPSVKGIEFGSGFAFAEMKGSEANDQYAVIGNEITNATNRNGGINGGITNSSPLIFRTAIKPTPSISLPQRSFSYTDMTEKELIIKGRHDPCIVHRARAVIEAVTALVLTNLFAENR